MNKKKWIKISLKIIFLITIIYLSLLLIKYFFAFRVGDFFAKTFMLNLEKIDEIYLTRGTLNWPKLKSFIIILFFTIIIIFSVVYSIVGYYVENKTYIKSQGDCIKLLKNMLNGKIYDSSIEVSNYKLYCDYLTQVLKNFEFIDKNNNTNLIKEELITNFAHDIKTPLTSIIGYLNLITQDDDISEKSLKKYSSIALEKALDLEKQFEELFYISKYDFKKENKEKNKINLYNFLSQIKDEFYPIMTDKGMDIEINIEEHISLFVNLEDFSKVLENIVNNAIKFGYENSNIVFNVIREDKNLHMEISNKTNQLSDYDLSLIFNRFYRRDKSRNSSTGGAGLGLAIAKSIVVNYDGNIDAKCKNDIFTIIINIPDVIIETS